MHPKLYVKRKEEGLYQKDLAKRLNIHPQTYHEKEVGKKDFTLLECKRLAIIFNCTLDDLFWEGENEKENIA